MGKLFEVREFDRIVSSKAYEHNEGYKYIPEESFENLIKFIHEFTGSDTTADSLEFMSCDYNRTVGECVSVKNYVGLIQMNNGDQIQILPKIDFGNDDDISNTKTKRVFLKMLRSLRNFPSKVFTDSSLRVDKMNLYELFINMYLQEVRQLVKHGMKSDYVEQEDNLRYYKGKLKVSKHIRENFAHKERFYVSFEEFSLNRPENRLIKATLKKLQQLTTSAENAKEIRQLLTAFEFVDASTNYQKDFAKVVNNRSMKDYELLMQWSRVFLLNQSFTTFSGSTISKAMLFPMESVYESYVAQQLKKIFVPAGWEVSTQDKGEYLFIKPQEQFALKPDIVLKKDGRTIVMDTKWKRLIDNERKNYGISQSDMYQMYAYSKKYGNAEVWLLYPMNKEMRAHARIKFESGDGTTVNIHFVDVDEISDSLEKLKEKVESK